MSLLRGLPEIGIKAAKKTAPFYSAVDEALSNLKRPKGTGIEFLTEVMKTKGVKKAEIADRKLEQAFKAKGKMTKEEAQEVLKENPPPQLKEKVYDESTAIDEDEIREAVTQEMFGKSYSEITNGSSRRMIADEVYKRMGMDNGTQYGRWKMPNGENYREILLKLPVQGDDAKKLNEISMTLHGVPYTSLTGDTSEMAKLRLAVKREYKNLYGESGALAEDRAMYRSNHFKEDPNTLAHMRVQDRTGPNGEKILHIEEIQSDWHQAGRKSGYKPADYVEQSNALEKEFKDLVNKRGELRREAERIGYRGEGHRALVDEANSITPRLMQLQEQRDNMQNVINYGVADAPFKKNWHELAMKRLLNYAAENGYDSIAITPGAEQAKRYSLSKHIDSIMLTPNQYSNNDKYPYYFKAFDKEGNRVADDVVNEDKLIEYIGKEPAQQLLTSQANPMGERMISGANIVTGGEGMKGFYDNMLPNYLNDFGKPYGAQVKLNDTPISTRDPRDTSWGGGMSGDHPFLTSSDVYEPYDGMVDLLRRNEEGGEHTLVGRMLRADAERRIGLELQKLDTVNQVKLHNFPITPEMRESIKTKGLPLYQQVGIPTAGAGAASQMLEPQEEPEYSKGGSIAKMAALAKLKQMRGEMAPRAEAVKSLIARDQNSYLRDVAPNSLTNPEIEAEIKRMAARAKASGQQEGVLPRAERDANLAKMLEQSEIQNRLYHGTTDDVPRFDPNTAGKKTGNLTTALGTFLSDNPAESSRYAELWGTEGGNVMPVFAQLKNPYVMPYSEYNNLAMGAWNRRMKDPDYDPNQIIKFGDIEAQKRASEALKKHEEAGLQDVIKRRNELIEQGHDSIVINIGGDREIIVFDPNKIKSATGNRGTYDINDPDVNKAKGGLVSQEPKYGPGGAIAKMALKAAPAPKAPQIIKPSTLTELKRIVEKEKGGYGARRVERAADEVPNLEKMYTLDALKERFTGDNAKALMTMSPADFEKFATELQGKTSVGPKAAESAKQGEISKYTVPTNEYVKHLERIAMFDSVPYLNLAKEEVGLPLLPYVSGHEGRHRSRALAGKGEKRNLVGVTPTMDLREGLPRRSQEEFIEAMKKELELSGGLVLPQSEPMMGGRPPIILPDVYAKGGSVKPQVKKSVSGKVKMSDNRDAMFMELSNKKLKRK